MGMRINTSRFQKPVRGRGSWPPQRNTGSRERGLWAVWRYGGSADSWEYPREQQRIMMNMKHENITTLLSAVTWLLRAKSSLCSIFFNPYSNLV